MSKRDGRVAIASDGGLIRGHRLSFEPAEAPGRLKSSARLRVIKGKGSAPPEIERRWEAEGAFPQSLPDVRAEKNLTIAIVGAGIGGLTLAIALQRRGFRPVIYERAPQLGEVGAGITLWPNANKVLFSLGLQEDLDRIAEEPANQSMWRFDTGEIFRVYPRGEATRKAYGAPLYQNSSPRLARHLGDGGQTPRSKRYSPWARP